MRVAARVISVRVYDAARPANESCRCTDNNEHATNTVPVLRDDRPMTSRPLAILSLLAVMVVWGSTFVVTKSAMAELPPLTMAFVRVCIGALVLAPFAIPRMRASHVGLPWKRIWAMSLIGVALYYVVFNSSLAYTSASQGALVQSSIPAVTALIAVLWLRESASPVRVFGIVLSMVGVIVVFATGNADSSGAAPAPILGNLLMFASVVCWGWYTSLAKRVADCDSIVITTWVTAIGAAMLMPLAAIELWDRALPNPSAQAWLGVAYLGVFASGAGYLLYNYALKKMAASQVGVFTNLIPIVGVLTGVVALGEPLAWQAIVGGAIVMVGVWLTTRS
jgi:drug/metabolite transporter (DMT)-like permease